MSLINFASPSVQQYPNENRIINLAVNDSLSTVLGAGYLNGLKDVNGNAALVQVNGVNVNSLNNGGNGMVLNNGDFVFINYSGGQGVFQVSSVSSNIVTLSMLGSPGVGESFTQITPTLSAFLAMYGTPIQLVPAQGANTLILLDNMQIVQNYGSAALAGGGVVAAQYDSTVHGGGVAASSVANAADFQQTASTVYPFRGVSGAGALLLDASCVNKGLYLSCASGVFTGGTASTFIVKVNYHVISTNS